MKLDETNNDEISELERIARDYFSTGFPNPERIDCPDKIIFQRLINEKKLPDENLQEHLLRCSECFQDYNVALIASREAGTKQQYTFWQTAFLFFKRPKIALGAGLLAVAIFCVAVFILFNNGAVNKSDVENASQLSQKSKKTDRDGNESNSKVDTVDKNRTEQGKKTGNGNVEETTPTDNEKDNKKAQTSGNSNKGVKDELLAKNVIVADFDNEITRSNEQSNSGENSKLKLKETSNSLKIKLPSGSPKGEYEISVIDAYSNKLLTRSTWSRNGKTALLTISLEGIADKADRLCLARKNEIPYCIPLRIE